VPRELFERRYKLTPQEIAPHTHMLYHLVQVCAISIVLPTCAKPHVCSHYGVANLPSNQTLTFTPTLDEA
jgi:hypothetical protein